jgi:hypothetical protein
MVVLKTACRLSHLAAELVAQRLADLGWVHRSSQPARTKTVQGWPRLWANFRALILSRDFQSKCWAKSRNLGQPCATFVLAAAPPPPHPHPSRD